ncbi:MAG: vWA domain-containing protein [Armatimonadota bacterium]
MLKWYEWHTASERLQARLYALTNGRPFKFRFATDFPTAYCDIKNKTVGVNPEAFNDVFTEQKLAGQSMDEANFLMSRALLGHEALHAVYTDSEILHEACKDPDDARIFNILEDARIEKIGSTESHVSKTLFRLLNATSFKMLPKFNDPEINDPYSMLHVLMHWRHGMAVPKLSDAAKTRWIEIRKLAEDSLYAPTSAEVLVTAHKIVDLLSLREEREKQEQGQDNQPSPDQKALRDAIQNLMNKMQNNMNGSSSQSPRENPLENPKGKGVRNPGSDAQGSEKSSPDDGAGQQEGDKVSDESRPSNRSDCDQPQGDPDTEAHQPGQQRQDNRQEKNEQDEGGDDPNTSIADVIQDVKDAVKESAADTTPGDADIKSAGAGGGRPVTPEPYTDILEVAIPIYQELLRELKTQEPKAITGASMYPGKLKMRYSMRDKDKPYARKSLRGLATPTMALSLVLDRSGSMSDMMDELKVMSMAIYLTCEKLKIPLEIWALEGVICIKAFDEWSPNVLAKIAGIWAGGGTNMIPTLTSAVESLGKRQEDFKQMVIVHDGSPSDIDDVMAWRKNLRHINVFAMHIHNGNATGPLLERMTDLFGVQSFCLAPIEEIPKLWGSFMKVKSRAR